MSCPRTAITNRLPSVPMADGDTICGNRGGLYAAAARDGRLERGQATTAAIVTRPTCADTIEAKVDPTGRVIGEVRHLHALRKRLEAEAGRLL